MLVVAVLCGCSRSDPSATVDHSPALKALISSQSMKVPAQRNHCEINGSTQAKNGTTVLNDVTVGDFIASYVSWSLATSDEKGLNCEGQQCTLYFGKGGIEAWDRQLRFVSDPATNKVLEESLECIDVP